MTRATIFTWTAAILLVNQLFWAIKESPSGTAADFLTGLLAVGLFQYMAWYAVFRLLAASERSQASIPDWVVAIGCCVLVYIPTSQAVWLAALGVGLYMAVFDKGDRRLRAAGIVLAALSVQQFWGHLLFELIASPLLRAETAVVGTILQTVQSGASWQDNIITGPTGNGIVVYPYCSSFHNLSLALLCWITVSRLKHTTWQPRDFAIGGVIGAVMVLLNVIRLVLMSYSVSLYHFWHDGSGAQIFAVGASLCVLLLSLYGAQRGETA